MYKGKKIKVSLYNQVGGSKTQDNDATSAIKFSRSRNGLVIGRDAARVTLQYIYNILMH